MNGSFHSVSTGWIWGLSFSDAYLISPQKSRPIAVMHQTNSRNTMKMVPHPTWKRRIEPCPLGIGMRSKLEYILVWSTLWSLNLYPLYRRQPYLATKKQHGGNSKTLLAFSFGFVLAVPCFCSKDTWDYGIWFGNQLVIQNQHLVVLEWAINLFVGIPWYSS